MASADFLRFVVTAHSFFFQMRPQDLPGYSHALSLFTCRIYRKRFRAVIGLCFVMQTHPRLRPYMRFLFVRPEICPLGDLLTPKIRLSSDSASRRTPLPLANPSHCRADSGLSPYRTCAHRAHIKTGSTSRLFCGAGCASLLCRWGLGDGKPVPYIYGSIAGGGLPDAPQFGHFVISSFHLVE